MHIDIDSTQGQRPLPHYDRPSHAVAHGPAARTRLWAVVVPFLLMASMLALS